MPVLAHVVAAVQVQLHGQAGLDGAERRERGPARGLVFLAAEGAAQAPGLDLDQVHRHARVCARRSSARRTGSAFRRTRGRRPSRRGTRWRPGSRGRRVPGRLIRRGPRRRRRRRRTRPAGSPMTLGPGRQDDVAALEGDARVDDDGQVLPPGDRDAGGGPAGDATGSGPARGRAPGRGSAIRRSASIGSSATAVPSWFSPGTSAAVRTRTPGA